MGQHEIRRSIIGGRNNTLNGTRSTIISERDNNNVYGAYYTKDIESIGFIFGGKSTDFDEEVYFNYTSLAHSSIINCKNVTTSGTNIHVRDCTGCQITQDNIFCIGNNCEDLRVKLKYKPNEEVLYKEEKYHIQNEHPFVDAIWDVGTQKYRIVYFIESSSNESHSKMVYQDDIGEQIQDYTLPIKGLIILLFGSYCLYLKLK